MTRADALKRTYWKAIVALREAETDADVAAHISGPADALPLPNQEDSWLDDWVARAKHVLGQVASAPVRVPVQIGQRAVHSVLRGAHALARTGRKAAKKIQSVVEEAQKLTWAGMLGLDAITIALLVAVAWFVLKKGR